MSRLQLDGFGDAGRVVSLVALPALSAGRDEVLVELEAATINMSDFLLINGTYAVRPEVPSVLGAEGVGRVVEAGDGVDAELVGRRVLLLPTYGHGTWATHAVVRADAVVPVPEDVDALQLAMIGINPMTALLLLEDYGGGSPGPGELIGQTAGTSAVGEYVVKLARLAGRPTMSVVRREAAAEQVRSWGGDVVVVDGEDLPARLEAALDGRRLSVAIDGVGGAAGSALAHHLRFGGTLVSYAVLSGELPAAALPDVIFNEVNLTGLWLVNWLRRAPADEVRARYAELVALVADGSLHARVDRTYGLDDWQDAFARAQAYDRAGKILFRFA